MSDRMYLRKKDLVDAMGMARGTVSDWLTEYSMFVPTVKHGSVTYYRPEALDLLRAIRGLKEDGFLFKPEVIQKLVDRGFPITAEEAVEDVKDVAFSLTDTRDAMTKVIAELARQHKELGNVGERFVAHDERMDGQDGRIKSVEAKQLEASEEVEELKRVVDELRQELATTKEQANKSIWRRMFRG